MNRMRMLNPALQIWRLVGKLARDIAVARDAFEAGTNLAVSADNARNRMAAAAAKTIKVLSRRRLNLRLSEPRWAAGLQAASISASKRRLSRILALSVVGACVREAVALAQP